jgi:hypothetical protein
MNQIYKPASRDRTRLGGEPLSGIASDIRGRSAGRVEYDDGDPATILPSDHRPMARAGGRDDSRPIDGTNSAASFRAPLAGITGGSIVEYDDGNPATIISEAD